MLTSPSDNTVAYAAATIETRLPWSLQEYSWCRKGEGRVEKVHVVERERERERLHRLHC